MPISFAAIVGGTVTLIGTSTNLVVLGAARRTRATPGWGCSRSARSGCRSRSPASSRMIVLTPLLLPDRRAPSETADADAREFTVELIVTDEPGHRGPQRRRGRAAQPAGRATWSRSSATATGSRRSARTRSSPSATGSRSPATSTRVLDLQEMRGLALGRGAPLHGRRVGRSTAASTRPSSPRDRRSSGRTLKQAGFRGRYGGAVIAIHRAGERIAGKLGEVRPAPRATCCWCSPGRRSVRGRSTGATSWWSPPLDGEGPPREEKAPLVGLIIARAARARRAPGSSTSCPRPFLAAFAVVALRILSPDRGARRRRPRRDRRDRRQLRHRGRHRVERAGGRPRRRARGAVRHVRRPRTALRRAARDHGADRADHQQRRGGPAVPGGAQHGDRRRASIRAPSPSPSRSGRRRRS